MLDDFLKIQPLAYKIFVNSKKKNRISHAYIIETNGFPNGLNMAIAFSKYLLCPKSYTNCKKCQNCTQCFTIDKNEFIELKVIEANGNQIKKDQIDSLMLDFSKKPVIGNKKIYIINEAEKLNIKTSNSILKFIEEPEEGIIAILITEDINKLLSTIVSRCQIITLKNNIEVINLNTFEKICNILILDNDKKQQLLEKKEEKSRIDNIIDFIKFYENNKLETIIYTNKLFHQYFNDRETLKLGFDLILLFYKDMLNLKLNNKIKIFNDYENEIKEMAEQNSLENILKKINVISFMKEKIKFNANATLLMDKLIIELEGCEYDD